MSVAVNEIRFFAAAVVCLAINLAVGMWNARERSRLEPGRGAAEQGLAVLGALCVVAGLVQSAARHGGWPLLIAAEVILASAATALSWYLLYHRRCEPNPEGPLLYTIVMALLMWGVARWPKPQSAAMATASAQQLWLSASHLVLAVACGAFIEAATRALACLIAKRPPEQQAEVSSIDRHECRASLPGLAILTASLLLTSLGGQYMGGAYWSWGVLESWQLLVWLFYTILWFAVVLLEWRTPRACGLTAAGLILTVLMLNAVGG